MTASPSASVAPCPTVCWRLDLDGVVRARNRVADEIRAGLGDPWRECWPDEVRAAADHALAAARDGETATFRTQLAWGLRERVQVEAAVTLVLGAQEEPEGFSASARDVTQEVETAAFLADIGHELRTPLHGIVAGMEMLIAQPLAQAQRELAVLVRCSALALEAKLQGALAPTPSDPGGIPLASEPSARRPDATASHAPPAALRDGQLQILVADDHPTNRRVVELILGEMACVRTVNDGQEAIDAFAEQPFDLVLMDIQMPVLDGVSAVSEIRRYEVAHNRRRTPIAMLTANTDPHSVAASRAAGADQHIAKPFTPNLLVSCVQALLHASAA